MVFWRFTRGGDSTELPVNPERITDVITPNITQVYQSDGMFVMAYGEKIRTVTLTGLAAVKGKDADDLWLDYFQLLYSWEGRKITISERGVVFDGECVLMDVSTERRKGAPTLLWYSVKLGYADTITDI